MLHILELYFVDLIVIKRNVLTTLEIRIPLCLLKKTILLIQRLLIGEIHISV